MDVKIAFLNEDLYKKKLTWHDPKVLWWKKKNLWDAVCRNPLMG
jgi:hypothetical protein